MPPMPRRPSGSVGHSSRWESQSNSSVNQTSSSSSKGILVTTLRTTESYHTASASSSTFASFASTAQSSGHHQSMLTIGSAATPQQKIIQVLVNRLKNKLPCNSGLSLDQVEQDKPTQQAIETLVEFSRDSLDMIAWALCELLDRLAKQTDPQSGHLTNEVLQSQLFILKVLSLTMASRWALPSTSSTPSSSRPSYEQSIISSPDSPVPSATTASNARGKRKPVPSEKSSTPTSSWQEPPPLDDSCVKYVLSVMVLFMRQAASTSEIPLMLQSRSTDISFRDFDVDVQAHYDTAVVSPTSADEPDTSLRSQPSNSSIDSSKMSIKSTPIVAASTAYERTHISLLRSPTSVNNLITKFVGRIIFHISASNWNVVHERLSSKIAHMATNPEANADTVDLHLMSNSILDKGRLVAILNQLSSLLVSMRKESQLAVTIHLRSAVWNWIDIFPSEFNDALRVRGRTEGAPERVFDLLHSISNATLGGEKVFWPTLMILNATFTDRISADLQYSGTGHKARKEHKFIDTVVNHVTTSTKLSEIALACAVDLCRAAALVEKAEAPLRIIVVGDIIPEIKSALYNCGNSRKPFWENQEDINVALYADALVAIFRFLPLEVSVPLFQECVEPLRSDAVKTCAMRASLTLVQDAPRMGWQKSLDSLAEAIAPYCRDILAAAENRGREFEHNGIVKRVASRPKSKRIYPEPLSDREVLILGVLSLWRSSLLFFRKGIATKEDIDSWVTVSIKLWESPIDISVKISNSYCWKKITENALVASSLDPEQAIMIEIIKSSLPLTLLSAVGNLLTTRTDAELQRLWMSIAHQLLEIYIAKIDIPVAKEIQLDPARIPAFALAEIAFLVSLPLADNNVSQLAAEGLRFLSHAERQPNAPVNGAITEGDRSKKNPIYEQLGNPRITLAGRLGHQKRVRKLIRSLTFSAGIHIVVWQECYWRWRLLNEMINNYVNESGLDGAESTRSYNPIQHEVRNEWQNLTLFLAALGGSCMQDGQDVKLLAKVIPSKYLPDKLRVVQNPVPLIENFIGDLINLLVAGDVQIRDIVRDALGSELSPRLYGRLIQNLESTLLVLERTAESNSDIDSYALVLEQVISILKLVADNQEVTLEDVMTVDISSSLLSLALFISRCSGSSGQRIKIKFCVLCESVCNRTDTLTMRKDSQVRHDILNAVMSWMMPLAKTSLELLPQPSPHELNMACLRASVKLLDRLQLKTMDSTNTGDDSVHVVSRLFNKYATVLLTSMEFHQSDAVSTSDSMSELGSIHLKMRSSHKEAELRELVITGLTSLVSENSETGFKQCLPLAYDQDVRKRTIFAHVFSRVIGQGTVFDPEEKSLTRSRHSALCELVRSSDMILASTICEICPAREADVIISVLLNILDSRSSLIGLMKILIDREVAQTDNEATIFRGNTTCTKFLSAFAKLHGYNYLRCLVQPLLDTMVQMPPGTGYEIDPNKAIGQDVVQNQKNVEYVASTFIQLMSSSLPALPGMFREISSYITKVVGEIWPESKYAAMGAFIFLRFISPAVVAPEVIDIEVPIGENAHTLRRGLMVIAKIIQNLANNIFFGKEAHMTTLNKFLESNIANVTRFLSEIHKYSPGNDDDHWLGTSSDDTDVAVLHRFFHRHADKIGKELLSLSRPTTDADSAVLTGKRAWDGLCALLVDLGPPLEVPRLTKNNSEMHPEYLDLKNKFKNKSTAPVQRLFVETSVQESTAVFVLRLSKIDVESLDIELCIFYILTTLNSELYRSRSFDVIVDCTSFTSASEVPLQWLKYCAELIPQDIRRRFATVRILNANPLTQRYLRRLYTIAPELDPGDVPLCRELKAYTSVMQLMEDVRKEAFEPLKYPVSFEQEPHNNFHDVTMKGSLKMPVILRVGVSHIRVTSIKSLSISPNLSCRSIDLIPLTDISDIYNVSTGQEQNEFIIRRRQGGTVYFSSLSREQIVKDIRTAKGRLKEVQAPLSERFARFSNVPATLLHIGFLSVDLDDEELRGAAYDLLGAVCSYLKYDKSPIIASKAGFISGDLSAFVLNLSEKLSDFAPQLTLDFIHEVSAAMTSMDKSSVSHRIRCLQYMSPWIQNLSHFANATHSLYERSGARLRDCIRTLSELSISYPEISSTIQKHIWTEVAKLDSNIIDIILDELVRTATDGGIGTRRCEAISHIVATLSSINVRGRIYSKLRKALSKVPPRISNTLLDHQNWNEISTLIRLSLMVGTQSTLTGNNYLYVPEVMHLVSLVAGEGPTLVRKSVYGIIVNLLQSLYIARPDDSTEPAMMQLMNDSTLPATLKLFGLRRESSTSEYTSSDDLSEKDALDSYEGLVAFLMRILQVTSGSSGLLNIWKARWMSLVTATAFQQSPAVQTRSFVALAALAVSEVDDDFLYQILVAFRTVLIKANESNTMAIISMLRSMCKIIPAIVVANRSRYISVLFWLAVALLQSSHLGFYVEATLLLRVTLEHMESQGQFKMTSVEAFLLEAREPLEEVMSQLDEILRLNFETSFSFSLASIIFKGMRHSVLKDSAEATLRTLLRITSSIYYDNVTDVSNGIRDSPCPEALGYFIALLPISTTTKAFRRLLNDCHIDEACIADALPLADEDDGEGIPDLTPSILGIRTSNDALLVASFAGTILSSAQGDDAETQILYGLLSSIANSYPEIISIMYETLQDRIKDVFANSSNAAIIRSVSNIFRISLQDTATRSTVTSANHGSTSTLGTIEENTGGPGRPHLHALEEIGMQGLAHNLTFLPMGRGHSTKMINWIPGLVTLVLSQ